ncbi:hypothetical protein J6590_069851 [Homalodisca vitripennis]|nr:hypothetical protein J6590_069851 [Homalodisca vitripennis]
MMVTSSSRSAVTSALLSELSSPHLRYLCRLDEQIMRSLRQQPPIPVQDGPVPGALGSEPGIDAYIANTSLMRAGACLGLLSALSRADPVRRTHWTGIVTLPGVTLFHE